jgi:two-component system OmpR family response regulator
MDLQRGPTRSRGSRRPGAAAFQRRIQIADGLPRTAQSRALPRATADLPKGRDAEVFDRSIDNQVSRLRRKIEQDPKNPRYIKTVWGGGYMFTSDVEVL